MHPVNEQRRSQHPRRPPAHKSVSLLHSPISKRLSPESPVQAKNHSATTDSSTSSSLRPLIGKDDSGESSNADRWFETSNNDVRAIADNDPPFFLQQSSSEEKTPPQIHLTNASGQPNAVYVRDARNLPLRAEYLHMNADEGNGSDEFRGVIDDLTIENRKLRQRLKRYEKLHDAHLKDDKLFEVRVHGLPALKKKELEQMLRTFAVGLHGQKSPELSTSTTNMHGGHAAPALRNLKTDGTMQTSHFTDSAYASASGQGSLALSGSGNGKSPFKSSAKSRRQDIHTYLHDIPQGLMPKQILNMSEKSKKKLVVRRLEQIFSGKVAGRGGHQHPLQQQELSQLAAKADRSASAALGQAVLGEGNREARIMPEDTTESSTADESKSTPFHSRTPGVTSASSMMPTQETPDCITTKKSKVDGPLEQRPTRPLDLDPQRAQVPFDNIEYIRHLGFSPPDVYADRSPEEGHGWMYLNLLINMAQLHTISVTPEFVKKALQEYSSRFELSSDGRKVRWRRHRGEAESTPSTSTPSSQYGHSDRKRVKLSHTSSGYQLHKRNHLLAQDKQAKFAYTPLFFHQRSSEDSILSSTSDEEDGEGYDTDPLAAASSDGADLKLRPRNNRKRKHQKRETGPIIFYSNAGFCTDLSGESKNESLMAYNPIMYHTATSQPVGSNLGTNSYTNTADEKGLLNDAHELPEAMNINDNPIPDSMELSLPQHHTPLTSGSERSPLDMEVSGLGGVYPADNFSINVRTQHARASNVAVKKMRRCTAMGYPSRLADVLTTTETSRTSPSAFQEEILSTRQKNLPPSELPPATCFVSLDGLESDEESDSESVKSDRIGGLDRVPPAAPQLLDFPSWDSDDGDEGEDADDASEGSLDFLATARAIDPESIRARELEYDANMAERLAEEIPAGGSAATVEGRSGSGYTSPASDVDMED